jgi:tyrosyl-tRNA synthetase
MLQWFRLAAGATAGDLADIEHGLDDGSLHPGDTKRRLARAIVDRYHGGKAAHGAEEAFNTVFRSKGVPDDIPIVILKSTGAVWLPGLLCDAGLTKSNGEARRLIAQGAVKVNGVRIDDETVDHADLIDQVLQVGKRRFLRLEAPATTGTWEPEV